MKSQRRRFYFQLVSLLSRNNQAAGLGRLAKFGASTLCALLIASGSSAFAATYDWIGASGATWGTTTNWSPNVVPGTAVTDVAQFNSNATVLLGANVTTIARINVTAGATTISPSAADRNIVFGNGSGITINPGAGAFTAQSATNFLRFHLGAGAVTGTFDVNFTNNSSSLATLNFGSDANSRIQGAQRAALGTSNLTFDGSGDWSYTGRLINNPTTPTTGLLGIIKSGTGVLELNVVDPALQTAFTGGLTLNNGTLNLKTLFALGRGALTITGGTLGNTSGATLTAANTTASTSVALNGNFGYDSANETIFNATVPVSLGASNVDITVSGSGGRLSFLGTLSGSGNGLTKKGSGVLRLGSAASTYTGKTIIEAGTLQLGAETGLGNNPGSFVADQLTLNGGTLQLVSGTMTIDDSNRGVTLGSSGGTFNVSGTDLTIANVIAGPSGALAKTGAGSLTLNNANTYGGGTTITAGTVKMGNAGALGSGAVQLNSGTLDANGFALSSTVKGNGTITSTGGPTTVSALVSPGNSPGTITFNTTTNFTGNYEWELGSYTHTTGDGGYSVGTPGLSGDWDLLNVDTNSFTIDPSATLTLKTGSLIPDSNVFWDSAHTWTIMSTLSGGSIVNSFGLNVPGGNGEGSFSTVNNGGTSLDLVWTPVAIPEPSSIAMVGAGLAILVGYRVKRRRA